LDPAISVFLTRDPCDDSDAQDPDLARKQILATAPILPGQRASSEYTIPPHSPRTRAATNVSNELIDFGDANDRTSESQSRSSATNHSGFHDLLGDDETRNNVGNDHYSQQPSLMTPLTPTKSPSSRDQHPIRRKDSKTSGVDEFVDARS
jgi:oxysterol-binding protein-related protein 8